MTSIMAKLNNQLKEKEIARKERKSEKKCKKGIIYDKRRKN